MINPTYFFDLVFGLVIFLGLVRLALGTYSMFASRKPEPPIARCTQVEVRARPDGRLASVSRHEEEHYLSDESGRSELRLVDYVTLSLTDGRELSLRCGSLRFDGGTTLRWVEHRWPKWWQRLLCPSREGGMRYYVCPRDWVVGQLCTPEEIARLPLLPELHPA